MKISRLMESMMKPSLKRNEKKTNGNETSESLKKDMGEEELLVILLTYQYAFLTVVVGQLFFLSDCE